MLDARPSFAYSRHLPSISYGRLPRQSLGSNHGSRQPIPLRHPEHLRYLQHLCHPEHREGPRHVNTLSPTFPVARSLRWRQLRCRLLRGTRWQYTPAQPTFAVIPTKEGSSWHGWHLATSQWAYVSTRGETCAMSTSPSCHFDTAIRMTKGSLHSAIGPRTLRFSFRRIRRRGDSGTRARLSVQHVYCE